MSGGGEDRDALAAEYVLGTLDAREAASVRAQARDDAALADAIAFWEERLSPLAELAAPSAPLPGLWSGIEAAMGERGADRAGARRAPLAVAAAPRPPPRTPRRRRPLPVRIWRDADVWRLVGLAGVVAGIAAVVLGPRLEQGAGPVEVAALVAPGTPGAPDIAAHVAVAANGMVRVRLDRPLPVEGDHTLALWAIPAGSTAPVLIGAVEAKGGSLRAPALPDGSRVMVTLEPPGGPQRDGTPGTPLAAGILAVVPADE